MANEFIARNGIVALNNSTITGSLDIAGNLTTTGTITAQKLVVQQVTSSVVFSSGSNVFGNSISNTQSMTGSVGISGSLTATGTATFDSNVSARNSYNLSTDGSYQWTSGGNKVQMSATNGIWTLSTGVLSYNPSITVTSGGNVGIAETNPSVLLQVSPATTVNLVTALFTRGASDPNFRAGFGNGSGSVDATEHAKIGMWYGTSGNPVCHIGLLRGQSANSNGMTFNVNNSEYMRINNAGNVGIGTTSPNAKLTVATTDFPAVSFYRDLDVLSVGQAGQRILIGARKGSAFTAGASITAVLESTGNDGNLNFETLSSSTLQTRLSITSSGNVGIGTTSPAANLHVKSSTAYAGVRADNTGTTGGGFFAAYQNGSQIGIVGVSGAVLGTTASDLAIFSETGKNIVFMPNGTGVEAMRITSGGNVGIGTTSPSQKLDVNGNLKLSASSSFLYGGDNVGRLIVANNDVTTYAAIYGSSHTTVPNLFQIIVNNIAAFSIPNTGNVGIGTTSPESGWKLDVSDIVTMGGTAGNGRLYISTDGTANGYTYIQARNLTVATPLRFFSSVNIFDSSVGIGTTSPTSKLHVNGIQEFSTNALAITGGLTVGAFYHTGGVLKVVI